MCGKKNGSTDLLVIKNMFDKNCLLFFYFTRSSELYSSMMASVL